MHNRLSCDSKDFPRKKPHLSHEVFRRPMVHATMMRASPSHLRARQLPQATDEAVQLGLGLASALRSQNDRMIKLRTSCHTIVVRFGSRLAHWIAARVVEVVALVNAPDMHIWSCSTCRSSKKDITAPPEKSVDQ